jgi:hypothetical protein
MIYDYLNIRMGRLDHTNIFFIISRLKDLFIRKNTMIKTRIKMPNNPIKC